MRISTGIDGLDQILRGGLIPSRAYLVHGEPGTGKTTLGLHFLTAGRVRGERSLLITFGEAEPQMRADAEALGLNMGGISILDLTPPADSFLDVETYDIFSPAEVEREPITREISKEIREKDPQRIFVDGFGQFRHLASDPFHRRRLVQSFFRFATDRGATLVAACEDRDAARDADGVIGLELTPQGRNVRITKFRSSDFQPGSHPIRITPYGMQVLPNVA
jgi:circadian clock protein KaiC